MSETSDASREAEPAVQAGFSLRTLLRHSWIYSLVPLLQRAAAIVLIPIITYALQEDRGEYGALELSDFLILLVPQFVGANLLGGLTRYYFEHERERDKRALVSSTFLVLALLSWAVAGVALALRWPVADLIYGQGAQPGSGREHVDLLILTLLIIPFSMTARMTVDYLVILRRPVLTTSIRLVKSLGVIAINIWFVVGLGWGAWGYLLGILIGEAAISLGFLAYLLTHVGLRFSWPVFRPMLLFSLPLLPMGLLQLGLHQLDRVLIKELLPAGLAPTALQPGEVAAMVAVAIYGLGYKIGSLIHVAVLGSFMQVWQPWLFEMKDSPERRLLMVRVGTYAMAALAAVYLPVALAGRQIVELLDASSEGRYEIAFRIAPWATVSYLFYAAYAMSQAALLLAKRSLDLLWISGAGLAINVALNFLLIPRLGILGAAYATFGSFIVMALLGAVAAWHRTGLCFDLGKVLRIALLALGCVLAARAVDEWQVSKALSDALPAIAVKALVGAGALTYLWRGIIDADGRAALVRIVRERIGSSRRAT